MFPSLTGTARWRQACAGPAQLTARARSCGYTRGWRNGKGILLVDQGSREGVPRAKRARRVRSQESRCVDKMKQMFTVHPCPPAWTQHLTKATGRVMRTKGHQGGALDRPWRNTAVAGNKQEKQPPAVKPGSVSTVRGWLLPERGATFLLRLLASLPAQPAHGPGAPACRPGSPNHGPSPQVSHLTKRSVNVCSWPCCP